MELTYLKSTKRFGLDSSEVTADKGSSPKRLVLQAHGCNLYLKSFYVLIGCHSRTHKQLFFHLQELEFNPKLYPECSCLLL